jgi:hypothetical protein
MASPVKKWLDSAKGRKIDDDGAYGAQCMDLYADYQRNCLKVTVKGAPAAKDVWNTVNTGVFTKIANTPSFVPQRGDVAVWTNGTYGHIAICEGEGNVNWFVSLDQNWFSPWNGTGVATYVRHDYVGVVGFLRPKMDVNFDQDAYNAEQARIAEANRVASELVKKIADDAAKAEAIRVAAEQKKLADELAKIEVERLAKVESDKLEEARLAQIEAERIAKEILDGEIAKQAEEANKEKEKGEIMSPKFKINKADLISLGKGFLITLAGAAITFIAEYLTKVNFGQYTVVAVPLFALLVNTARKWLVDNSK